MEDFTKIWDNLNTAIFTATVKNKKNPEQVFNAFIKILSDSGSNTFGISDKLQKQMFEREGKFYIEFLSEATKLAKNINGFGLFFPKLYHFSMDPMIIITENMAPKGFDKNTENYSLAQSQLLFEHLARFHALSYYIHHELKRDLSVYENFLCKESSEHISIALGAYKLLMEVGNDWDGGPEFVEKMRKFEPHYYSTMRNLMTIDASEDQQILVLTHGDCHKHNYLFRNNMEDCSIIDHQLVSWLSPGVDLIASFNTFCEPEVNINSRDYLLKCYHREFKHLFYWTAYCPLASIDTSSENSKSYAERFRDALDHPRQRKLAKFFPTFLNRGYLDYEENI
ncbi:uncharacterized protein LOC129794421 [Lutzomyia longipalpis]|uniref:uncharacterized protein LOC129794421 n=1 Tax=Lutzomyia longipalpis TaxID=7200 RepID=UPI00248355CB|nr:uncharacterized protein LOC129794421 [Lutzomyia longipalpis]